MKRIIPILLSLVLVISLAIPAFADTVDGYFYGDTYFPVLPAVSQYSSKGGEYSYIAFDKNWGAYIAVFSPSQFSVGADNTLTYKSLPYFVFENGSWAYKADNQENYVFFSNGSYVVWSSHDILKNNGGVYFEGTEPSVNNPNQCDGSTCPATDKDHNNVCDDCGAVLTYNLRSSLLDYVKSLAEDYASGYPYYAVFENTILGGYNLHISKQPITIDGADYDHVVGTSGQWTHATTDDSGVHSHDVFVAWNTPVGGTLVYANHEIENFQMPPLAVVIQGVTEGELMEVTLPNLAKTMKILVPCGVGCLALLIVLSLFGKRSLISRN